MELYSDGGMSFSFGSGSGGYSDMATDTEEFLIMTTSQLAALKDMGWDYLPTGPDEYDWLKIGAGGRVVARGGDKVWAEDVVKAWESGE